jgi:hypothetical protein
LLEPTNSKGDSSNADMGHSAIEVELAKQTLELSMSLADEIRQSLTLLRVSIERPGIVTANPQLLVSAVEDSIHRHILMTNDIFLAATLRLPKTQKDIKEAINSMPAHLRM